MNDEMVLDWLTWFTHHHEVQTAQAQLRNATKWFHKSKHIATRYNHETKLYRTDSLYFAIIHEIKQQGWRYRIWHNPDHERKQIEAIVVYGKKLEKEYSQCYAKTELHALMKAYKIAWEKTNVN